MDEYIRKDKAIDIFIEGDGDDEFTEGYNFAVNEYREKIRAIPAADVQPIEHGKWLKVSWNNYKCSLCDTQYAGMGAITFIYCPNCGANMRGDTE